MFDKLFRKKVSAEALANDMFQMLVLELRLMFFVRKTFQFGVRKIALRNLITVSQCLHT